MNKQFFETLVSLRISDEEWAHISYIFGKCSLNEVEFARNWVKMNYHRVFAHFEKQMDAEEIRLSEKVETIQSKLSDAKSSNFYGEYASVLMYLGNDDLNFIQSFIYEYGYVCVADVYTSTIKDVCEMMNGAFRAYKDLFKS